jgi:flagellum-specific ATP synthase
VGAYVKGSDPRVDEAIQYWPGIQRFLSQDSGTSVTLGQSVAALQTLLKPGDRGAAQ